MGCARFSKAFSASKYQRSLQITVVVGVVVVGGGGGGVVVVVSVALSALFSLKGRGLDIFLLTYLLRTPTGKIQKQASPPLNPSMFGREKPALKGLCRDDGFLRMFLIWLEYLSLSMSVCC